MALGASCVRERLPLEGEVAVAAAMTTGTFHLINQLRTGLTNATLDMHASTQTLQCSSRPFLRQLTCRRLLVSPVRSQSGSDPQSSKQQKVPGAFNRFFKGGL